MSNSNDNDMVDAIKASLAKVLPGALVTLMGTMLMLALGIVILTEGPTLVRPFTDPMPQPVRSILFFASLAAPMFALGYTGRRFMGYILSQMTRN